MTAPSRSRPRPLLEEIEARILYSADAVVAVDALAPVLAIEQRSVESGGEFTSAAASSATQASGIEAQTHELVFIDASLPDANALIADIARQQTGTRQIETVLIDPNADGIGVITGTLAQRQDVGAVHILGHGSDGEVQLGSTRLDFDSLLQNATQIRGWGNSLSAGADVLVYGCDVAYSDAGRALIDALSRLTGADVAASDDPTGNQRLGGDWNLEYQAGAVQTALVISAGEQAIWDGLLDIAPDDAEVPAVPTAPGPSATIAAQTAVAPSVAIAATPMLFEQNVGQSDAQVDFIARGNGYGIWLTGGDAVLSVAQDDSTSVVRLNVVGKNAQISARGEDAAAATTSYLVGTQDQWRADVTNYTAVRYDNVYDGIDLRYYGNQRQLEYDFVVQAGADASAIVLRFDGAQNYAIADNGDLTLTLDDAGHTIAFKAPVAYQDGANGREAVASRYLLAADGTVSFELAAYDHNRTLVIDPVLSHATYFGGSAVDNANGVAVDAAGYVYVASYSQSNDLPITGTIPGSNSGGQDVSVAKFTPDLSALVYSVYIGGGGTDQPNAIAVDGSGRAYVTGHTNSTDFAAVAAYQATKGSGGGDDAFVFGLNTAGNALVYSTYLGGSGGGDEGIGIAVDAVGNAYVAGSTNSSNFPISAGAADSTYSSTEAFVAKFNAGGGLTYSTFFGGAGVDIASGVAIEASGNVVVVGQTTSSGLATASAYQVFYGGSTDAFLVRLNNTGSAVLYSTYLGGTGADIAFAVALDASGKAYITGQTNSSNFDVSAGAYQTSNASSTDAFMSIINPGASGAASLVYSTYLGGSGNSEAGLGIGVDGAGRAYVTGYSDSNGGSTGLDAYVAQIAPNAAGAADLLYYSVLGGIGQDRGNAGVYSNGKFIIAGDTATTLGFATAGRYDTTYNGGTRDSFAAIYTFNVPPTITLSAAALAYAENAGDVVVDAGVTVLDSDSTLLAGVSVQISANYVATEDLLAFDNINVWGITGTWNASTATLTLSGAASVANYQAALRSVTYRNSSEQPNTIARTVSFSANDGSQASATVSRQITVASIDDAPAYTLPGAQTVAEDSALVFSLGNANRIIVSDVDAGTAPIQVTLTAANGKLTLSQTTGLTFVTGNGSGNPTMTFTGATIAVNAALEGLRFDPAADFNGATGIQLVTNDQGNTGSGGPLTTTSAIAITVTAVNDPPINYLPGPQSTAQNTALVLSSSNGNAISVIDVDAASGTLQLTLSAANGTLTLATLAGLSGVFGNGTANMTFSGNLADLNAALDGLTFTPTPAYGGPATILVSTSDLGNNGAGGAGVASGTLSITVSGNAAPVIVTTGGALVYTEQAGAMTIDGNLTVSDTDTPLLDHAVVWVSSNYVSGEDVLEFSDQLGINGIWDAASGTLMLSGAASAADYQTALRSVTYRNPVDNPPAGARTISFTANDGTADGPVATRQILVSAVNDPPTLTVPFAQSTNEDTLLLFSAAQGNQISIADVDAGASQMQLNLSALNGTLTLAQTAGLIIVTGADGSGAMTLAGTIADLNAALNGLLFTPAPNFSGTARVDVAISDNGNSGTGPAGVAAGSVTITVATVNDAPAGVQTTVSTLEDTPYTFAAIDFGFSDTNDSPGNQLLSVHVTTLPGAGTLKVNGAAVVIGQDISIVDINAGRLVFTPGRDASGTAHAGFSFQVRDDGLTANGGIDLDPTPRTITFDVTAVNDAPVGSEVTVTMSQNGVYTFSAADFQFNDPNDAPSNSLLAVRIASLPVTGTLTFSGGPIAIGQLISAVDIAAGKLRFAPAPNAIGAPYSSFTFQLQDTGGTADGGVNLEATPHAMKIDVTEVNQAPQGSDTTVSALEDAPHVFSIADFGFSDSGNSVPNSLLAVKINTIAGAGTLTANAVVVNPGDLVSAADIAAGRLIFTAAANGNGAGYASFTFQVRDDGGTAGGGVDLDASPNTLTIDVAAVNDAPSGSSATLATVEDVPYTFAAADFGFGDTGDVPADGFSGVRIVSLPGAGTLSVAGIALVAGQTISLGSINAGAFKFTPSAEASGAGYAAFTFRVQDDGGTASGGIDLDASARTITLDVTQVNDAPSVAVNAGAADNAGATLTIGAALLSITDVDNTAAQIVYALGSAPTNGMLLLSGAPLAVSDTFTQAQVDTGLLQYLSTSSTSGTDAFVFSVADGAGGTLGPLTFNITVNAMAAAPAPTLLPAAPPALPMAPPALPPTQTGATPAPAIMPAASNDNPPDAGTEASPSQTDMAQSEENADAEPGSLSDAIALADASPSRATEIGAATGASQRVSIAAGGAVRTAATVMLLSEAAGAPVAFGMSLDTQSMDPQFGQPPATLTLEAYQTTLSNEHWVSQLNQMRDTVKDQIKVEQRVLASGVAVTGGLSVGYVIWLLRGGLLLTSLLSSLPAWHVIDPMPVLARSGGRDEDEPEDDDPLESLFGKARARLRGAGRRDTPANPPRAQHDSEPGSDGDSIPSGVPI